MGNPRVRESGARGVIAVLEQIESSFDTSRAQVQGHHRLHPRPGRPGEELTNAKGVGLERVPCSVEPHRPLVHGAHAVFPAVAGHEVASGITNDGDPQLPDQVEHIAAQAVGVRARMTWLVDSRIDTPSEMFHERSEEPTSDLAGIPVRIED